MHLTNTEMKKQHKHSVAIAGICFISVTSLASILSSNLVAHLPLNNNANDVTGNGHDGTVYGSSFTSDRFGNPNSACDFDGINDYIDFGNDASLDTSSSITI